MYRMYILIFQSATLYSKLMHTLEMALAGTFSGNNVNHSAIIIHLMLAENLLETMYQVSIYSLSNRRNTTEFFNIFTSH